MLRFSSRQVSLGQGVEGPVNAQACTAEQASEQPNFPQSEAVAFGHSWPEAAVHSCSNTPRGIDAIDTGQVQAKDIARSVLGSRFSPQPTLIAPFLCEGDSSRKQLFDPSRPEPRSRNTPRLMTHPALRALDAKQRLVQPA